MRPVLGLFCRLCDDVVRSVRPSVEPLTREGDDAATYNDAEDDGAELGGEFMEGGEEGGEEEEDYEDPGDVSLGGSLPDDHREDELEDDDPPVK